MVYINDPRGTSYTANAAFFGCHINAWPVVFVVATADIAKDDQIYVDYGDKFWKVAGSMSVATASQESEVY
eukprot:3135226-Rhodomonas_salina.1